MKERTILGCSNITEEGLKALARLPKLEKMHFKNDSSIGYQGLNYFRTLKKLVFQECKKINVYHLCKLMTGVCKDIEEISVFQERKFYDESMVDVSKIAEKLLKNRDVSLSVRVLGCGIRITPIRCQNNTVRTHFYEVDERIQDETSKIEPVFVTYDESEFINVVEVWIDVASRQLYLGKLSLYEIIHRYKVRKILLYLETFPYQNNNKYLFRIINTGRYE